MEGKREDVTTDILCPCLDNHKGVDLHDLHMLHCVQITMCQIYKQAIQWKIIGRDVDN